MAGSAYGQGIYYFDFKISEPCTQLLLNPADIYPPTIKTSLNVKSVSATNDRILLESRSSAPEITLQDGDKFFLQNNLKYDSYITEEDYKNYIKIYNTEANGNSKFELKWWYIVLPVFLCCFCCGTFAFAFQTYRKRRLIEDQQ